MNKIILTSTFIAACGFGAFAASASAQTASDVTTTTTVSTAQQDNDTVDTAVGIRQVPAPGSRNCIQQTGSHITNREQKCLPLNGNSYTREDLERTGDPNLGRALHKLDPLLSGGG